MRRGLRLLFAVCLLAAALGLQKPASAAPRWTTAAKAPVHPGVQIFTKGSQCTANFVFYDTKYTYIGQAAHCASKGDNTNTNGCTTGTYPLGTKVQVGGASKPGTIVYSSWVMMQHLKERSDNLCYGNDLALIRLDPLDRPRVNPSIPHWGGPTRLGKGVAALQKVYTYGNSELRGGVSQLSPHWGDADGDEFGGWSHGFYTVLPGIPGDSGSALVGPHGEAIGILSTLSAIPPLQNNASDLYKDLVYMKAHVPSLKGVTLALGTVHFDGSIH